MINTKKTIVVFLVLLFLVPLITSTRAQSVSYVNIKEGEKYEWEINVHVNNWDQWFADNMTNWFVFLYNHDYLSNLTKVYNDWSWNATEPQAYFSTTIYTILLENTSQLLSIANLTTDVITYTPFNATWDVRIPDSDENNGNFTDIREIANDTSSFSIQNLYGGLATNPYWLMTASFGPSDINWTQFASLAQWGVENYWGGWIANTTITALTYGYSMSVPTYGYINNSLPITINVSYDSNGILSYSSFDYGNLTLYDLIFSSYIPVSGPPTGWDNFIQLISYPPGATIFIFLLSLAITLLSTLLTKLLTDSKQLKEKQDIIKEHQDRRKEIEELKEENPKKFKKELAKWERLDKPVQAMQQKMGLQRMKPMCFTFIPYMIIFPVIAGLYRSATGNAPVAIPPMNPFDIPLLGNMMWASTELIPVQAGLINYTTWYILCSFTWNTVIGRLAGTTQSGGGLGQMFDKAKYDSYKT